MSLSQVRKAQTPADRLRDVLTDLEARVGKLGVAETPEPLEILALFDRANQLLHDLQKQGVDLAAERTRFNTTAQQFRKKGKAFLKEVGARQLQEARQATDPPAENWWWSIDQLLAEERGAQIQKTLRRLGLAAIILAIISVVYIAFLQPDEATRQRITLETRAEQALMTGAFEEALESVNSALTYAPEDANLLLLKGVILLRLDREDEAEALFSQAREMMNDLESFYTGRAQAFMTAGWPDRALMDAQTLVELKPDSAYGYYQMGNANFALGNYYEASLNFEKASELAQAAGLTELEAMARAQLAYVSMALTAPRQETSTPSP